MTLPVPTGRHIIYILLHYRVNKPLWNYTQSRTDEICTMYIEEYLF